VYSQPGLLLPSLALCKNHHTTTEICIFEVVEVNQFFPGDQFSGLTFLMTCGAPKWVFAFIRFLDEVFFGRSPFLASQFGAILVQIKYQTVENMDVVDRFITIYGT
jgi:hypothetical protein